MIQFVVGETNLHYIAYMFKQNFSMDSTVHDGEFLTNKGKNKDYKLLEKFCSRGHS